MVAPDLSLSLYMYIYIYIYVYVYIHICTQVNRGKASGPASGPGLGPLALPTTSAKPPLPRSLRTSKSSRCKGFGNNNGNNHNNDNNNNVILRTIMLVIRSPRAARACRLWWSWCSVGRGAPPLGSAARGSPRTAQAPQGREEAKRTRGDDREPPRH